MYRLHHSNTYYYSTNSSGRSTQISYSSPGFKRQSSRGKMSDVDGKHVLVFHAPSGSPRWMVGVWSAEGTAEFIFMHAFRCRWQKHLGKVSKSLWCRFKYLTKHICLDLHLSVTLTKNCECPNLTLTTTMIEAFSQEKMFWSGSVQLSLDVSTLNHSVLRSASHFPSSPGFQLSSSLLFQSHPPTCELLSFWCLVSFLSEAFSDLCSHMTISSIRMILFASSDHIDHNQYNNNCVI